MIENIKNPCDKHCPRRSMTCHSTCKEYLKFWKANFKRNRDLCLKKEGDFAVTESHLNRRLHMSKDGTKITNREFLPNKSRSE